MFSRQNLRLFSSRDVEANSGEPRWSSMVIHLHATTRAHPTHTAVCANNPKLCLVFFAGVDRLIHCLPDSLAIFRVPAGNQVFECNPSGSRETQLSTPPGRDPDLIFLQIPLPHSEIRGVRGEVESLLANFQFTREMRRSNDIATELIAHHR